MITVEVPVAAELLAASVNVLVPVVVAGLNVAVTPFGMPVADRPMLPVKPLIAATLMLLVPLKPCVTVRLVGDDERPKSADCEGAAGVSVYIPVEKRLLVLNELVLFPVR
jgi:hypothetical protein